MTSPVVDITAYRYTTIPANSQIVYLLDSTRLGIEDDQGSVASATAPGRGRGYWSGHRVRLLIKIGDQNVTWTAQILTDNANAAADFETDTTLVRGADLGTGTLAASGTYKFTWYPAALDFRFLITAGVNNPDDLDAYVELIPSPASET